MDDLISRQAAIDLVRDVCNAVMSGCESLHDPETKDEVYEDIREVDAILKCNKEVRIALRNMPSAQPQRTDCTDCPEYDHEAHSCPKYCEVIRKTAEEAKQERTGRWMATEADEPCFYRCSECGRLIDERENFCPNCGAKMEEPEDIPMEYFENGGR